MSADLDDLKRIKLTSEAVAWLEAEARFSGKTKQEVLRDVIHEIALKEIRKAKLLLRLSPDEGIDGDTRGRAHK